MKKDFLYRLSLVVVPRLFVWLARIWFATCRIEERGGKNLRAVEEQGQGIACFYHYSIVYMLMHLRRFRAAIMVSASKDGEYIARICKVMGHVPVRGSRNRQGVRALKDMISKMEQGYHGGIVADGSQGPVFQVQAGVIMMAAKSGAPILPMAWAADRYISFGSWDRTALPKPFSKIVFYYGTPCHVNEKKLSSDRLEHYRLLLQNEMDHIYHQAWSAFGRQYHHEDVAPEKDS